MFYIIKIYPYFTFLISTKLNVFTKNHIINILLYRYIPICSLIIAIKIIRNCSFHFLMVLLNLLYRKNVMDNIGTSQLNSPDCNMIVCISKRYRKNQGIDIIAKITS